MLARLERSTAPLTLAAQQMTLLIDTLLNSKTQS
jgi:hypothetical protein